MDRNLRMLSAFLGLGLGYLFGIGAIFLADRILESETTPELWFLTFCGALGLAASQFVFVESMAVGKDSVSLTMKKIDQATKSVEQLAAFSLALVIEQVHVGSSVGAFAAQTDGHGTYKSAANAFRKRYVEMALKEGISFQQLEEALKVEHHFIARGIIQDMIRLPSMKRLQEFEETGVDINQLVQPLSRVCPNIQRETIPNPNDVQRAIPELIRTDTSILDGLKFYSDWYNADSRLKFMLSRGDQLMLPAGHNVH